TGGFALAAIRKDLGERLREIKALPKLDTPTPRKIRAGHDCCTRGGGGDPLSLRARRRRVVFFPQPFLPPPRGIFFFSNRLPAAISECPPLPRRGARRARRFRASGIIHPPGRLALGGRLPWSWSPRADGWGRTHGRRAFLFLSGELPMRGLYNRKQRESF